MMKDLSFLFLVLALGSACGVPCPGGINETGLFVVGDRVKSDCGEDCIVDYGSTEDPNLLGSCFGLRTLALQEATGRLAAFDGIEVISSLSFHRKTRPLGDREVVRWELDEDTFPALTQVTKFTSGSFNSTSIPGLNTIEEMLVVTFRGGDISGLNSLRSANWMNFGGRSITGLQSFETVLAQPIGIPPSINAISSIDDLVLPSLKTSGWNLILRSAHGNLSAPVLTKVAGNLGGAGRNVSLPAIERVGGALIISGNGLNHDLEDTEFVSVGDSVHALHLIIEQTTTYNPDNFEGHVDVDGAVKFVRNDSATTAQMARFLDQHVGTYDAFLHCRNGDDDETCTYVYDDITRPSIAQLQCQVLGDCEECERRGTCL